MVMAVTVFPIANRNTPYYLNSTANLTKNREEIGKIIREIGIKPRPSRRAFLVRECIA